MTQPMHETNRKARRGAVQSWLLLFLALSVASGPAVAAVGYQFGAAANYSDNITRAPGGELDDVVSNLNAAALWSNQSPRLAAAAFVQLSYLDYLDDTFDDEAVPRADVNINWDMLPARLSWVLEDRFGQIASDPFASLTPDNIENTNVLRLGPDLIFGSSTSQLLTLSVRAEDHYYEEQAIDNQRLNSTLQLMRQTSAAQSISLNVYGETVQFEDSAFGTDYELYEAYVTVERSLSEYDLAIDAGGTEVRIGDESLDGLLARLGASRAFDSSWYVQLTGEYSYTDSGNRFLIGREQSSAGPGQTADDENLVAASSPLQLQMLNFHVSRNTARQNMGVDLYWEKEQFELESDLDRVQTGGSFVYDFALNQVNELSFLAGYKKVEFDSSFREDETLFAELRFRRNLTENLSLEFRVARAERSSSDPAASFEENIGGLNLTYQSDVLKALNRRSP